jgi:hypothetical protein
MIVKEASYLFLQWGSLLQTTEGAGALEEFPLELRGNGIPLLEHGRAQALQDLLFLLGGAGMVVANLAPLNRPVDMERHPFFVFSKRRVGLLELAEFLRFVRRSRCVGQKCPELGRFRSVLLCSEHSARPFPGIGSTIGRPAAGDVGAFSVDDQRIWGRADWLARSAVEILQALAGVLSAKVLSA